ncbi:hypothetical protein T4E_1180 [Trichinella pseudospiralis]|uniref:Retrovirus-related Pol polyprotein from transposon n=1 Tax=Trichinella pseudospiralis TaxID=6337 RepID=A0A0V0XCV0_TRIPS|nr:hypothetical protein T4E_1180 [Trichinella pseudospiralis]
MCIRDSPNKPSAKAFIDHPDDWDAHLDRVLLAYQSSAHHTTGATRSRVIFRREMRLPVDLVYSLPRGAPEESVGEHTRRMRQDLKQLYKAVRGRAGREQRRQKFWKDRKAHGPVPYEVQKKQVWNTYWVKEMKGRRWSRNHGERGRPRYQPGCGTSCMIRGMSTGRAHNKGESGAADMDRANGIFPPENKEEVT